MDKIKVFICDDMEQIRDFFKMIVDSQPDMEYVGSSATGEGAVEQIPMLKPDIVLMDIQMESDDAGIIATEKIKKLMPDVKIIMLTIHEEDDYIYRAYGVGAVDYIVKSTEESEVRRSIRRVYENKQFIRPVIAQKVMSEFSRLQKQQKRLMYTISVISNLTSAEMEILKALYNGMPRKEIARQRYVELVTIKTQIGSILKKLRYKNTKELLNDLRQLGIFEIQNEFDKKK